MSQSKVALVTGSGKHRIGASIADALGRRGFRIVLHYLTSGNEARESTARFEQLGIPAIAVQADLTVEADVKRLIATAVGQWGRLDVLVTCASIWRPKRLEETTASDVKQHFEANTLSTFLCCQHAGLLMVGQPEGGCIVTIGDWAIRRPYPDYAAYFPSKGAIPALTRSLAVELGTRNPRVRVNCVHPGPAMIPSQVSGDERQAIVRRTLVAREGRPDNVAQAVLYLVENDFVTGDCLTVDGGRSIYAGDV